MYRTSFTKLTVIHTNLEMCYFMEIAIPRGFV